MMQLVSIELAEAFAKFIAQHGQRALKEALARKLGPLGATSIYERTSIADRDSMARRLSLAHAAMWLGTEMRGELIRLPPDAAAKWMSEIIRTLVQPASADGRVEQSVSVDGDEITVDAGVKLAADYSAGARIRQLEDEVRELREKLERASEAVIAAEEKAAEQRAAEEGQKGDPGGMDESALIDALERDVWRVLGNWRQRYGAACEAASKRFARLIAGVLGVDMWPESYGSREAAELHFAVIAVARLSGRLTSQLVSAAPNNTAARSFASQFAEHYEKALSNQARDFLKQATGQLRRQLREADTISVEEVTKALRELFGD